MSGWGEVFDFIKIAHFCITKECTPYITNPYSVKYVSETGELNPVPPDPEPGVLPMN